MSDESEFSNECMTGDVAKVHAYLARGVDVNSTYDGKTPLMTAVEYNKIEIVKILLARDDLDISTNDNFGFSALHIACTQGYADCAALLVKDRRMNRHILDMKSDDGPTSTTPLMIAVQNNQLEIIKILLTNDDLDIATTNIFGGTALHTACLYGNADCVALLGKDRRMTRQIINLKPRDYLMNSTGDTALMQAVKNGFFSCVERMTEIDGVDWETKNRKGESLEDVARHKKYIGLLKFLRKIMSENDSPSQYKKMKLSKLTHVLENLDDDMKVEDIALGDEYKKKVEDMEEDYAIQREDLDNELREKLSTIHGSNEKQKQRLANRHKKKKEALKTEIKGRVSPVKSVPPAPECPICLDSLAPPARLYNCPEGHLLCSGCRIKVEVCQLCRKPLQGRATAMEQYLRAVYGQE